MVELANEQFGLEQKITDLEVRSSTLLGRANEYENN